MIACAPWTVAAITSFSAAPNGPIPCNLRFWYDGKNREGTLPCTPSSRGSDPEVGHVRSPLDVEIKPSPVVQAPPKVPSSAP